MKNVILIAILVFTCACGTMRYQLKKPTDGKKASTELQWDIIELKFNQFWKDVGAL